jgi:hypothetical protein
MAFAKFMASAAGRGIRIVLGLSLIFWGLLEGTPLLAVAGLVPLAAGVFNWCLLAPLIGAPFRGIDALKA